MDGYLNMVVMNTINDESLDPVIPQLPHFIHLIWESQQPGNSAGDLFGMVKWPF